MDSEYKTLKDNTEELKSAIGPQLNSLGAKLVATRLMSSVMYSVISASNASESHRAAAVIEIVEDKVQKNPQCYHTFVAVLMGDEVRYERILQKLQDTYQSYEQQSRLPQGTVKTTKGT